VRTTASLPTRMIMVDRKLALLPTNLSDARMGAVLVRSEGTITALYALFELLWTAAAPFGSKPAVDPRGLHPQEAEALRLLADGNTDEAIAKRLGVSPRTARRIAADLMDRLEARSRFEAGVHAVQDGWLPAER
jgi:DNA-binding NarL/FixJ family response regulator